MEKSFSKRAACCIAGKKRLRKEYKACNVKSFNPKERRTCRIKVAKRSKKRVKDCMLL